MNKSSTLGILIQEPTKTSKPVFIEILSDWKWLVSGYIHLMDIENQYSSKDLETRFVKSKTLSYVTQYKRQQQSKCTIYVDMEAVIACVINLKRKQIFVVSSYPIWLSVILNKKNEPKKGWGIFGLVIL